jgi:hypothetical protein
VAALCPTSSIPLPRIGHNPRHWGITGVHTWLWDDTDPRPVSTSGSIRGYAITCTLTPTTWTFDTGDPHAERFGHPRTYTSRSAGHEGEDTDVQHLWEVKGTFALAVTVTWDRTTTAGADRPTRTATTSYQVKEIRAGYTAPG